jgi:NADH:ubiquinone oxidoreductase subunit 6 (subunit J)
MSVPLGKGVTIGSRAAVRLLFTVLGFLLALDLFVTWCHLVLHRPVTTLTGLVDMDLEGNMPALFSTLLFLALALLSRLQAVMEQAVQRRGWNILAATFLFLGLDEAVGIHEKCRPVMHRVLERYLATEGHLGWLDAAWVVPYVAAAMVLLVFLSVWMRRLAPRLRRELVLSGCVYLLGAVVLEMAGGRYMGQVDFRPPSAFPWLPCAVYVQPGACCLYADPGYVALYLAEETLEASGLVLCVGALLRAFEARGVQVACGVQRLQ